MLSQTTKNRFGYKLDKLFWFFIAFLPLIGWVASLLFSTSPAAFGTFITEKFGLAASDSNPFYSVFVDIFGSAGIFPLFAENSEILIMFSWLATGEIIHVLFDVLIFIPRLAHKWISKAVQDD